MEYSTRIVDAFALAHRLHAAQTRKESGIPYLAHLVSVAGLVGDYGGTEDQFIAALLHDAVEDQGGQATLQLIRASFGDAVADMVWYCSDTDIEPKPPWRARKEMSIAKTRSLPADAKLVIAADKLHNARAILQDLATDSGDVFARFKGKRDGTLWYYREMLGALRHEWEHPILDSLERAIDLMDETV